jgi:hypothetical protein
MRSLGVILAIVSGGLWAFSIVALLQTQSTAELLSWAAAAGEAVEPALWRSHWLYSSIAWFALSGAGLVAGCAVAARRLWGVLLWSIVVTVALAASLFNARFLARYQFETLSTTETLVWLALCAASWSMFAILKIRRSSRD